MSRLNFKREGADWPLRDSSRFVDAGGLRWHVQELGNGPPALLVHGTAASTHSWRGLAPLLAPHLQLLAFDLPGHGFTSSKRRLDLSLPGMADAVASLIETLHFKPRVVIGHSAGAAILARLIAEGRLAPDLFVAINGAFLPFEGFAGPLRTIMARVLLANPLAARLFAWSADRNAVANLLAGMGTKLDARGLDLYARLMRNPTHCAGALEMMAKWDLSGMPEDLSVIRCPTLFVVGAADKAIRPADAEKAARGMSNAKIDRLPGLGHLAHEEAPERVAQLIREAAREVCMVGAA